MSSPDDIIRLRTTVQLYERELKDITASLSKIGEGIKAMEPKKVDENVILGIGFDAFLRIVDLNNKLLNAYREYVRELEKLTPPP